MENLYWLGFAGALAALLFALQQKGRVMSYSEGTPTMQKIAGAIRSGANAYLKHQYATVAKVFAVVFVLLLSWPSARADRCSPDSLPLPF